MPKVPCMGLRDLITKAGLRQKDVAAQLGTSEPNISRWVNGEADVPSHFMRPLAGLLKVDLGIIAECGVRNGHDKQATA